ncbi:MAG: type II toxin-antitoxin system Phd/YefM family antitoxin [Candidatus Magasanikbacteria bacterium]|nr:type II toxin-antitoxin system Phd/YefM family antitoxin [Candidatus Magasanikbacteria bacterium]
MLLHQTLSITDARSKIFALAEKVQRPGTFFTLTEKGRAKAVVMSAEEFESWRETLEIRRAFPNLREDAALARRDYKKGNYITLEDLLAKEGFVLAKGVHKNYAVPNNNTKKSSKRYCKN